MSNVGIRQTLGQEKNALSPDAWDSAVFSCGKVLDYCTVPLFG